MSKSKKIRHLFEKKIDFENNANFQLPDEVYTSNKWSIPSFQNQKEELNKTKGLLNQFNLEEWSRHTKHRDPSSYIIRFVRQKFHAELVTQAWCKFYECLCTFPIIPKEAIGCGFLSSVHLCEAPGAFISALNHYMVTQGSNLQWQWCANSLNPDYEGNTLQEMIPDDRLMRHTHRNWYFGADHTGNITRYHNHVDLLEKIGEKVWLVTADGSIDCSLDPGNQELYVEYLHYCETVTALSLLKPGGTFVLKIFTMFEDSTICLLYLLNTLFKKVSIFKPASSKSGNSEVYVISLEFKGLDCLEKIWDSLILPYKHGQFDRNKSMFDLNRIDKDFLNQLLRMSDYFMKKQIERISENIYHFRNESQSDSGKVHQLKVYVANRYIHKYKVKSISPDRKLVQNFDVSQFLSYDFENFAFVNKTVRIDAKSLIPVSITGDILDIKLGLRIDQVKSSRFCARECLDKFKPSHRNKSGLYQTVEGEIAKTTTIISIDDCTFTTYHEFQRYIFYKTFNSTKSNFLIVKVPFVTNFLLGLMFVLFSCYEHVYVHESGFICLYGCNDNLKNGRYIFGVIDEAYKNLKEDRFPCDICQIVAPGLFYNNSFFEFVWNYNNVVFAKL